MVESQVVPGLSFPLSESVKEARSGRAFGLHLSTNSEPSSGRATVPRQPDEHARLSIKSHQNDLGGTVALVGRHLSCLKVGPLPVTKTELRRVITKLDDVKIELVRLRTEFLHEERPTPLERRRINLGRREIEKGRSVTLAQLRKELGVQGSVRTWPCRSLCQSRPTGSSCS